MPREALLRQASALSISDNTIVPVHAENHVWGTRANTRSTPRADGRTNAIHATPVN